MVKHWILRYALNTLKGTDLLLVLLEEHVWCSESLQWCHCHCQSGPAWWGREASLTSILTNYANLLFTAALNKDRARGWTAKPYMANHCLCGIKDSLQRVSGRDYTLISPKVSWMEALPVTMKSAAKNQINCLQRQTQKLNPKYCTTYPIPKVFFLCKQLQHSQNIKLNTFKSLQ